MATCGTLMNLGVGKCPLNFTALRRAIFVPIYDSNGEKNSLSAEDAKTLAAWQAKFDAANTLDRFYPTPIGRNITPETADPQTEEFDDGTSEFLGDGAITVTMLFPLAPFRLQKALNSFRKRDIGVIFIDQAGNITNNDIDGDGTLYPLPVDKDSLWNSKPHFPSDGSTPKVDLTFQLLRSTDFTNLKMISRSDLDFNPLGADVYALDDVEVAISNEAVDGFTFAVEDLDGNPVEGIEAADIAIYDQTNSAAITPSSVIEQTEATGAVGTYDVVIPAITGGATLSLTLQFSGYEPKVTLITIPA